jgi:predicted anti-sigma-YlaC factor YlaD
MITIHEYEIETGTMYQASMMDVMDPAGMPLLEGALADTVEAAIANLVNALYA